MSAELDVALEVAAALEAEGARYVIGGSLASSRAGEPRSTLDIDLAAELDERIVVALIRRLGKAFYVDAEAAGAAVRTGSSFNLIHEASAIKVDVFIAHTPLDRLQMERRRKVVLEDGRFLYFCTAEDILLQKLLWYQTGGEVSDRQWRDIAGIVATQGAALDQEYLRTQAAAARVSNLLDRALG
ncbi:MAG: hypothetical protein ACRD0Y_13275 [Terriglobales bacterium]